MSAINRFSLGSISHGTLRAEDLAESFLWELGQRDAEAAAPFRVEYDALFDADGDCLDNDSALAEIVDELSDALSEACPDYVYFGAHEGDGADFGFWVAWESLEDDIESGEVLRVDDTSEVPGGYTGLVYHVSDHGNGTLYSSDNGELTEVWACV